MAGRIVTQLIIAGKNLAGAAINQASAQLDNLGSAAKKVGAVLVGAFAVGAFSGFIKDSIDAADAASKAATATGLTVEQYTALKFSAGLAGIEIGQLDGALGKFNKTIDAAAQGEKKQVEAFARLGVSVRDAGGSVKSNQALFAEVADVFAQLPAGVEKSALAMELFGKSGAKLLPLLNAGSAGIAELNRQAEELGLVLSSQQVADAEAFNDSLSILGQVADGAANRISGDLLPALNDLTAMMIDVNKSTGAGTVVADLLGGALKALATVVLFLGTGFSILGTYIGAAAASAVEAAKGNFTAAGDILRQAVKDNDATAAASALRIKNLWTGAGAAAVSAASEQKNQFAKSLKDQEQYVADTEANNKKLLADAKKASAALLSEHKKAAGDLKKLQKQKVDIAAKYDASKAGAGGAIDPTYGNAQQLKINARNALQGGDVAGAKSAADQALKVIEALEAAGGNTYGLRGFKDELQGIEQAAADIEINQKAAEVTLLAAQMADLEAKAKAVSDALQIKPTLDPAAAAEVQTVVAALAAALGQTLTIPVRVVPVYPGGEMTQVTREQMDAKYPGHARGGRIRGPGTGTSDSILARLSNGEFVMRAAAVRAYGPALLEKMNGLRLPKFAEGGMIGAAMSAPVGQAGRDLGRVELNIGGQTHSLLADAGSFDQLRMASLKFGRTHKN
jgi:hypothetical protein